MAFIVLLNIGAMARQLCKRCDRPEKACICGFSYQTSNTIPVVILQHTSEVTQSKGTVTLLKQSLSSCSVIVGEDFSQNEALHDIFNRYQPILLYPSEQSQELNSDYAVKLASKKLSTNNKPYCLILLDGTWKKAYKMYQLSSLLHTLPQIHLPEELANAGRYHIRKVAKKNALSSLEACCYALSILEHELVYEDDNAEVKQTLGKYHMLMEKFDEFNQFQLSFRSNNNTSKDV